MAKRRGSSGQTTQCIVCSLPAPFKKYNEFPWHLTCAYDEAGQKKIAQWKREQKGLEKAAIPTLDLPG